MIKQLQHIPKKYLIALIGLVWLYVIPIVANYLLPNFDNPHKVVKLIEADLQKKQEKFEQLSNDARLIEQLYNKNYSLAALKDLAQEPFSFQIYETFADSSYELKFWNKNSILSDSNDLRLPEGKHIIHKQNETDQLIKHNLVIGDKRLTLIGLIPLYWSYFIETDYLQKSFAANAGISKQYTLSEKPTLYPIKNGTVTLFYINKKQNIRNQGLNWLTICCRLLSLIGLIVLSIIAYHKSIKRFGANNTFLLFIFIYTVFWILLCKTNLFFNRTALEVFDPNLYAVSGQYDSLAHLLFAVVLVTILVTLLANYKLTVVVKHGVIAEVTFKSLVKIFLFELLTFYCYWLIKSIINNSTISFNVTNFFSLNIYSVIGFLVTALICYNYYIIASKLIGIHKISTDHKWHVAFAMVIIGFATIFCIHYIDAQTQYITILLWLILFYHFNNYFVKQSQGQLTLPAIITIFLGISIATELLIENNKKELIDRKFFAKKLAFQSDPNTENLLSIALSKFSTQYFDTSFQQKIFNVKAYRTQLISDNFLGYLNKFQTNIYVFDSVGNGINNDQLESLSYFKTILQSQAVPLSSIANLYFVEVGVDQFSYIFFKEIVNNVGSAQGFFVIQANPLTYKNKSAALSPELFKQRNVRLDDKGNNYIYAIYNNYELRRKFFDYDLPVRLGKNQIPMNDDTIRQNNGYEELWYKLNTNSVVIVGKKQQFGLAFVTLFAYLFLALLLINGLFRLIQLFYKPRTTKFKFGSLFQISLSQQIQSIVWVVSLFTFIVVSYVIIIQFQNRFDKNNKERLNRTMQILLTDVQNKLNTQNVFDDVVKVYEPIANAGLKEVVMQMSEIHNVDFNIYNLNGDLKISSQPFLQTKEIVSSKIDAAALYNLMRNKSAQYIQNEKIGKFNYLSMYVPIRDERGNPYGYLNIPYYSSVSDLNQEISNFLIIIINITAFVFLIAGLIAWVVTNRITNTFSLIGSKMKATELGKNEPIVWNRNDEIGGLIQEYNKMVNKLAESAQLLAKNEREGAWREMARQVAHEIKNPLTPMKLSIQYLQKASNSGEDVTMLTQNVSKTLIDQIEHLNTIASDFSSFANIAIAQNKSLNITDTITQVINLMQHETNASININTITPYYVTADSTQMNRLFTNLIKNALQAYDDKGTKTVNVELRIGSQANKVEIRIVDFAKGIPLEIQSKIFTPNFTTKSSGTGLGLAICKGIVENTGGDINFETSIGKGTAFIINLPLIPDQSESVS